MMLKVNRLATFVCTIAYGSFLVSAYECRPDSMVVILNNYLSSQQQICLRGICSGFNADAVSSAPSSFQAQMLSDRKHLHFSSDQIILATDSTYCIFFSNYLLNSIWQ